MTGHHLDHHLLDPHQGSGRRLGLVKKMGMHWDRDSWISSSLLVVRVKVLQRLPLPQRRLRKEDLGFLKCFLEMNQQLRSLVQLASWMACSLPALRTTSLRGLQKE